MSIKSLANYLKGLENAFQKVNLDELVAKHGGSLDAVVDGSSLLYYLYINRTDTTYGGNFQHFTELSRQFCTNLSSIGIKMTVVFDGVPSEASDESSIKYCSSKCSANVKAPIIPPLARNILIHVLRECRIPVVVTPKEAYRYILTKGRTGNPDRPVLTFGYDASLLIQDVDAYIYIDSISYVMDTSGEGEETLDSEPYIEHVSAKISYRGNIAKVLGLEGVISRGKGAEPISPLLMLTHLLHAENSKIPEYMFSSLAAQLALSEEAEYASSQEPPTASTTSANNSNSNNNNNNNNSTASESAKKNATVLSATTVKSSLAMEPKEGGYFNKVESILGLLRKYCKPSATDENDYEALMNEIIELEVGYVFAKREEQRLKAEALAEEMARLAAEKARAEEEEEEEEKAKAKLEVHAENAQENNSSEAAATTAPAGTSSITDEAKPAEENPAAEQKEKVNGNEKDKGSEEAQEAILSPSARYFTALTREELIEQIRTQIQAAHLNYVSIPETEDPVQILCDMISEKNATDGNYVKFAAKAGGLSRPFISSVLRGAVPYEVLQSIVYRRILLLDTRPTMIDTRGLNSGLIPESNASVSRELRTYFYAQLLKGSGCNYVKEVIRTRRTAKDRGSSEFVVDKVVVPHGVFNAVPGIAGIKAVKPIDRFIVLCKACGLKDKDKMNLLWRLGGSSTNPDSETTEMQHILPHILVIAYLMSQKDKIFTRFQERGAAKSKSSGQAGITLNETAAPYADEFIDNINGLIESITIPAKTSVIKNEIASNTIQKSSSGQIFFNEYLFAFNYLYVLNALLQNPIHFSSQSFWISGAYFLHHRADASSGRGNLIKWRRRLNQKGREETPVSDTEPTKTSNDGFQKVGREDDKGLRMYKESLEVLSDMELNAYPKGISKSYLDTPRKSSNELIRQYESRSTAQAVLREGSGKFNFKPRGGNKGRK